MIREELLHPIISHFPIAMLVSLSFIKLAHLIVIKKSENWAKNLKLLSTVLLGIGSFLLLPTLFLGEMATDIIKVNACNLTKIYAHEELAESCLYIFIAAIFIDVLGNIDQLKSKISLQILCFIFILIGNYYLFQTGHTGAELVYEYGTAVSGYTCP